MLVIKIKKLMKYLPASCANKSLLKEAISKLIMKMHQEYYLTDIVSIISKKGFKIKTCVVPYKEVMGANTKTELAQLESIHREMRVEELLEKGVTVVDPKRTDIRGTVSVGKDCYIDVNVILEGDVVLGDNVSIGANTIIKNVEIGSGSKIEAFSHLVGSKVGNDCIIGPYARLREGSFIDDQAKIGNFQKPKNESWERL